MVFEICRDDILKEGWLMKQSKHYKTWRRRWVVLTPKYLATYRTEGLDSEPSELVPIRECSGLTSRTNETGKGILFKVVIPGRALYFAANTSMEKEAWISNINRHMVKPSML